jgi:hypothetical protein
MAFDVGDGYPLGDLSVVDSQWTANYNCARWPCLATAHLYCIQQ